MARGCVAEYFAIVMSSSDALSQWVPTPIVACTKPSIADTHHGGRSCERPRAAVFDSNEVKGLCAF